MPRRANEPPVKPAIVFRVCLAVALSLFAGSIAIGVIVVQSDKDQQSRADTP